MEKQAEKQETKSVGVDKLRERLDQLRTGLTNAREEKQRLEEHLDNLNDTILRTDGAVRVLADLIGETEQPTPPPPAPPAPSKNGSAPPESGAESAET